MPLLNTITTPYAEAFLQLSEASGETEAMVKQAKDLLSLWSESPALREAMSSPVLEIDSKKKVIGQIFADQISPTFLNLLKLLADRQRIGYLDAVLERYLELYRDQNRIALASVSSAQPLTDEQLAAITERVRKVAGTDKVEVNTNLDPALIGGFVLSVGSKVIDASLAGQVRRLGLALAKVN